MSVYLKDPKTGKVVPFSSDSGVDYKLFLNAGYSPVDQNGSPVAGGGTAPSSAAPTSSSPQQPAASAPSGTVRLNVKTQADLVAAQNDYENIQPVGNPDQGGYWVGTLIPKVTLVSPNGQRIVARSDNKTGTAYPPMQDYINSGFQLEKAPGIGALGASAPGTLDLSARPTLVLPNGQRISPQDPSYSEYEKVPGVTKQGGTPAPTGAGGASGAAPGAGPTGGVDQTGWTDAMKQSYSLLEGYLKSITSQGKVVNPDITIDAATIARFTDQAKKELEPYYGQLFQQTAADLEKAINRSKDDYYKNVQEVGRQYGTALENTQEDFARRGLEFSSDRTKAETRLADEADRNIKKAEEAASRSVQDLATQGERKLGSSSFPSSVGLSVSTGYTPILNRPGVYDLGSPGSSRQLYFPGSTTTGTLEQDRLYAEEKRKLDLVAAEREYRGTNYL